MLYTLFFSVFCLDFGGKFSAPLEVAPDLMGFHKDTKGNGGSHCYFKKQPQTLEEVKQAIEAVSVSCCGAVRYCGVNPDILKAIR